MAKREYSAEEQARFEANVKEFGIRTGQDPANFGKRPWRIFDPGKGDPWRELRIVDADGKSVTTLGPLQDPTDMTLGNALHIIRAVNGYDHHINALWHYKEHKRAPEQDRIDMEASGEETLGEEFNRLVNTTRHVAIEIQQQIFREESPKFKVEIDFPRMRDVDMSTKTIDEIGKYITRISYGDCNLRYLSAIELGIFTTADVDTVSQSKQWAKDYVKFSDVFIAATTYIHRVKFITKDNLNHSIAMKTSYGRKFEIELADECEIPF